LQPSTPLRCSTGHATQDAGEITGNALETSMNIEFPWMFGPDAPNPRMENTDYLMASGIAGSINDM
jgi:amidase